MEDIEDLLAGAVAGGATPGFRLLPPASVAVNPKNKIKANNLNRSSLFQQFPTASEPTRIPGTQTIYIKTFGCSHNQSDSEYMAGQLSAYGYALSDNPAEADLWLINTCTVKSPSQSAMDTLISKGKGANKALVVAGCVPQGSRNLKELEGVSIVGVQQIDRVVEVVEETLKGHEVHLLIRKTLPALDLPKVRKNRFVEILPINVGCLGACTYCKTKHARGHLGSYTVESLVRRVRSVIADGVKEIWLSSEDTGAYGRDIGVNLPILLNAMVAELPSDRSTMLRIGMTNPPYILEHLKEIANVLCHPCVYSFLHVPVQSGSDAILSAMNREYTVGEFKKVVDTLLELVPGMLIATDIICGFPGETADDFAETINLVKDYKFSQVHISQFYPRPGTPAARMKKVPSAVVKKRSRELTCVFEAFTPYNGMEGKIERVWITEIATDGIHLVGHTKAYIQVLIIGPETLLGTSAIVKIASVGRWSVFGEVVEVLSCGSENMHSSKRENVDKLPPCSDVGEACACLNETKPCNCDGGSQDQNLSEERSSATIKNESRPEDQNCRSLSQWLLRKRKNNLQKKVENGTGSENKETEQRSFVGICGWGIVDLSLLGGALVSFLTVVALCIRLGFWKLPSE